MNSARRLSGPSARAVAGSIVEGALPAEAAGDRLHELGEDLLRRVLLGTGDERCVPRDVRHDEETFHRRDGTSATRARIALGALQAETESGPAAAVDRALERDRPTVGFRDVLHDRKAQARTGKLTGVVRSPEAVEHAGCVLRGTNG